jgi:O-antigen/teichoic acid export membrane protein
VLLTNVDVLAVKVLSAPQNSDALSGAYQVAAVLARAPLFIGTALVNVFYPRIAEQAWDRGRANEFARDLLRWLAVIVLPVNAAMVVAATAVVLFFFPERYAAAATSLGVLALGSGFLTWASALAASYQALGRTRGPAIIMVVAVATQVLGLAYAVPRFGMLGAATASAAASFLACLLLVLLRHDSAVTPRAARRHVIALVVMTVAVLPLAGAGVQADRVALATWGIGAVVAYGAACCLLRLVCADQVRGLVPANIPSGLNWLVEAILGIAARLNQFGSWSEQKAGVQRAA